MGALRDDNHAARMHSALYNVLTHIGITSHHDMEYFENISVYRQIMAFRHRR